VPGAAAAERLRRRIILLLGFFDGVVPAVSSARHHGGQLLSSLRRGGGSLSRRWELLFASWRIVSLVDFRAGGGCPFRSVCLGDSMAGRCGFGAALLLSLDGGGASFFFHWCSTGWWPHLPMSVAPRQSCAGGLSGARYLLRRRRPYLQWRREPFLQI